MAPEKAGTKRKRGRPPANASRASEPQSPDGNEADNDNNDADAEEDGNRTRKRGRPTGRREKSLEGPARTSPRLQRGKNQPADAKKAKRGRSSVAQRADDSVEQQPQTKRLGRKRKEPTDGTPPPPEGKKKRGRAAGTRQSLDSQGTSTGKRRGRRRKSTPEAEAENDADEENEEQPVESPRRRGRPKSSSAQRSSSPESDLDLPAKPYLHVVPFVRGVKQSTIDEKWSALTGPSIAIATETLELAHRPILQRLSNSQQRRQHTSAALAVLYKRITRKLHRGLPFPPATTASSGALVSRRGGDGGRELELDFESVIDAAQALERQLDPTLHAIELLRKEKERMERELEKDYKTLQNLEAGARGQVREHREQMKKAHVLAPEATRPRGQEDMDFVFEGQDGPVPSGTVFKNLEDEELKELALQLGGHIESIKSNLQQTEGLLPQLATSRAALRGVLCQHLGQAQYEKVLFG